MDLLKKLIGQGLDLALALDEDGIHLLVGSLQGLTISQRQTIQNNRDQLIDELRNRSSRYYNRAMDLPLPLLPEDIRYIDGTLAYRPPESTHQLLTRYLEVWIQAAATEPREQRKENSGRRAANTWIREQQH
jgi:hypothetical protein